MARTLFKLLVGAAVAVALPHARKRIAQTTMTQVHRVNQ
jgi:hypothetical protein